MQGTIHRLIRGKGFGFIQVEERQYFFHHSEVRGIEFRQLSLGDVVEFQPVEEEAGKNPRAVEVLVVVKAVAPPPRAPAPEAKEAEPGPRREKRPRREAGGGGTASPGAGPRRPGPPGRAPSGSSFGTSFCAEDNFGDRAPPFQPADGDLEFSEELPSHGSGASDLNPGPNGNMGNSPEGRTRRAEGRTSLRRDGLVSSVRPRRPTEGGQPMRRPAGNQRRPQVRSRPRDDEKSQRAKATGTPGERGEGVIRSINMERGFGFIETVTGDIFFHRSGVKAGFDDLGIGSRVAFVFGEGDRGAKAEDISAV